MVFDDPEVGLRKEPFVCGIDGMMDRLVTTFPTRKPDFKLLFFPTPFPGYSVKLTWRHEEYGGNGYFYEQFGTEGWFCPALQIL